jgi:hypothetical protein
MQHQLLELDINVWDVLNSVYAKNVKQMLSILIIYWKWNLFKKIKINKSHSTVSKDGVNIFLEATLTQVREAIQNLKNLNFGQKRKQAS